MADTRNSPLKYSSVIITKIKNRFNLHEHLDLILFMTVVTGFQVLTLNDLSSLFYKLRVGNFIIVFM